MDVKELLKFQLVSHMGMGHNNPSPSQTSNQTQNPIFTLMYQFLFMLLMSMIDDISKSIPVLINGIKKKFTSDIQSKAQALINTENKPKLSDTSIALTTRHHVNTLEMVRTYQNTTDSSNSSTTNKEISEEAAGMVDAILDKISRLDNVPNFNLIDNGHIMINFKDKPIQITSDIYVKVVNINIVQGTKIESIKLRLMSNTLSAAEIANYARNVYNDYQQELKNSIGNKIYFFDQKSKESQVPQLPSSADAASILQHKQMRISSAPKQLSFTMSPFYSNKQFSNIYGKEVRLLEKRLKFFLERKDWYDSKGIPYQIGFLLSGIPGAGKTSIIRAIANITKRHIVNVNFANITTATQLKNLFYVDKIQVYTDSYMSNMQSYHIPINQRIYVIEELDGNGDIVKQRNGNNIGTNVVNDELNLQEILTVLDGTMEIPGRIVIMTTNHPEILDEALIRPGRIDVQIHFDYASKDMIVEMFKAYMDIELPIEYHNYLPDKKLTPAEVGQVLFRYFGEGERFKDIVEDLNNTARNKQNVNVKEAKTKEQRVITAIENSDNKKVMDKSQEQATNNSIITDITSQIDTKDKTEDIQTEDRSHCNSLSVKEIKKTSEVDTAKAINSVGQTITYKEMIDRKIPSMLKSPMFDEGVVSSCGLSPNFTSIDLLSPLNEGVYASV